MFSFVLSQTILSLTIEESANIHDTKYVYNKLCMTNLMILI
jgi:hypothetical protein